MNNNSGADILEQQNSYADIRDHSISLDDHCMEASRFSVISAMAPTVNTLRTAGVDLTADQVRETEANDPNNHVLVQ